jgi:hypothetical protein
MDYSKTFYQPNIGHMDIDETPTWEQVQQFYKFPIGQS